MSDPGADSRANRIFARLLSAGPYSVRVFRYLVAVYIFMLVLLPSGSILGVNVKIAWFLLLLPMAFRIYFGRGRATASRSILLLVIPAVLLLWLLLAQINGFETSYGVSQYKDLLVTISSCWFVALLCAEGPVEAIYFVRAVIMAEVTASSLKGILLTYSMVTGIQVTQIVGWLKSVFGVSLMTMDFESMLGRIQFVSDGLIPVCIFAILFLRKQLKFGAFSAISMLILLLLSDFFAFSRYFWAFTAVALVLGLLLGQKDKFQLALIVILSIVVLASLPILTTVISLRFSSSVVDSSDQDRAEQTPALEDFFASAPILGHGLGSYTRRVIRSDDAPYSYEVQLLAMAGQIGLVGLLGLGALGMYYFRGLWPGHGVGLIQSMGLSAILAAWIGGGLVNPELMSSAASVFYASIFAMLCVLREHPDPGVTCVEDAVLEPLHG
jgi:hypothetical protein